MLSTYIIIFITMPEVCFYYLEGVAGCANYLNIYTSFSVCFTSCDSSRSHTICTPPTGQHTCVSESNKDTINFTSIGNNDGTSR